MIDAATTERLLAGLEHLVQTLRDDRQDRRDFNEDLRRKLDKLIESAQAEVTAHETLPGEVAEAVLASISMRLSPPAPAGLAAGGEKKKGEDDIVIPSWTRSAVAKGWPFILAAGTAILGWLHGHLTFHP